MSKKQTGELCVLTNHSLNESEFIINPNDGFDLGLMMTEVDVILHIKNNSEQVQAIIIQKNECKVGTLEIGSKSIQKFDGNEKVRLYLNEGDNLKNLTIEKV
jgi:hypothetical protein